MRLSPREIEDLLSEDVEEIFDPAEDDADFQFTPALEAGSPVHAAYAERNAQDYDDDGGDYEYWRDHFKPAVGDDFD